MTARDAAEAALQEERLRSLGSVAFAVHRGVELESEALAIEAIRAAAEGLATPDRVNREFTALILSRLAPSFPRSVRGFTIELGGISAFLFLPRQQTLDLVPAPATTEVGPNGTSEIRSRLSNYVSGAFFIPKRV